MKHSNIIIAIVFMLIVVSFVYADDNWDRPQYQFNDSELKTIISELNMTFYEDINNLQLQINNLSTQISVVNTSLWNNFQYYYTKTEINNILNNYYNKTEIDNKFTNYYNKTEVDNKLINLNTSLIAMISSVNDSTHQSITQINNSLSEFINTTNQNITNIYSALYTINNSLLYPNGSYLYFDGNQFYVNESALNNTINIIAKNRAEIYYFNETSVSGNIYNISTPLNYLITEIKVIPTTLTNNYRFEAKTLSGDYIDKDRKVHVGIWDIEKNYAINQSVTINITNINIDEEFIVEIHYLTNGVNI